MVGETLSSKGLLIMAGRLTVFLLTVEVVSQIVLTTEVGTVTLQGTAITDLGLFVSLLVVVAVALP